MYTVYVCFIISLTAIFFLAGVVMEQCENSWAKSVGLKDRRAPWSKKWGGARAQRANRSLRLWPAPYQVIIIKSPNHEKTVSSKAILIEL